MTFFSTFRARLLLILAFMLVATLGVQYYLNLLMQEENDLLREAQTRALVAGITLGFNSLTSQDERVRDLVDEPGQTYLDEATRERIRDIIIIDNHFHITDSLHEELLPTVGEDDEYIYKDLEDVRELPPLMNARRLGADARFFPNANQADAELRDDEAHAVPIETSKGRWYVMVLLRNDSSAAAARAAQPLIVTLAVLSISTLVTIILVWRFTRPVANISNAAKRVAAGDLKVKVPGELRNDEMGQLSQRFNEMVGNLEKSKQLEDQLQQAEKSAVIGRLGSAIAHEIRNPLNYINLTLDHLRSKFAPAGPEQEKDFKKLVGQIKDEVARINQQITDFLNYSRPVTPDLQPADARKVVEGSMRLVEGQAAENSIKVSIVEHENVPPLLGDPEYLRSVFSNLFINALQAMGTEGGQLSVKISPEDGMVRFEVSDSGNGISADNIDKIFEPYFSTKETGTGLGLAIVQKIVDMHNGSIGVESKEGEGTKFTLKLPKAGNQHPNQR